MAAIGQILGQGIIQEPGWFLGDCCSGTEVFEQP
jgi:hypothetical protein